MSTENPSTEQRLAAIRERHGKATDGPWWFDESDTCWRLHGVMGRIPPLRRDGFFPDQVMNKQILKAPKSGTPYAEYWPDQGDAAFIVNAWKDVRDLLAELNDCLSIEDVEHFLKRERDEYESRGVHWVVVDDVLDVFRLHMVTGTPLTQPQPQEGPSDLSVGSPPLTEAEELRAEVDRLKAELAEMESAVSRVRALHAEVSHRPGYCYCANPYPCPTIRALGPDGEGGEPRG